jgi:hypothetical protein
LEAVRALAHGTRAIEFYRESPRDYEFAISTGAPGHAAELRNGRPCRVGLTSVAPMGD